jgi:hypothetical protein
MPSVKEILLGKKGKLKTASTLSKTQEELQDLIRQGLESGEGPYGDIFGQFDEGAFEKGVSEPLIKQFQSKVLPKIQGQLIAGGHNARGGAFRRGTLEAGTDLQERLAQLMYQAQQDQTNRRAGGVNNLFGRQSVENIYKPGTKGAVQGFVEGAGQGLGQAAGAGIPGAVNSGVDAVKSFIAG